MCGICGVWYFNGQPASPVEVKAMTDKLAHRGPDGEGMYLEGSLGLGHRRLAILDLSLAGQQPMSYADGRYRITFNGEIYNFLELRAELESKGYTFRSTSDTEVILAAYIAWGSDCLLKFNGMWAFAIWDSRERQLFLVRDRFGVKPLFYLLQPKRFAFASELKAFLELPGFVPRVNLPVLKAELLDIHSQEGGPNCLLHDVYRLPGGHWMRVNAAGQTTVQRWWRTLDHLVEVPHRPEEQAEQFRALFADACRLRMRSDVPIGTSLSGGLDSSAVVCMLAQLAQQGAKRQAADWQRAFVATFPGTPVDERPFAELVIQQTDVLPTWVEISVQQTFDLLAATSYHVEQVVNGPLAALWCIYQSQRQAGVVVTLDGHGGDELLAGYPHYTIAALYDAGSWPTRPRRYRELLDIYRGLMTSPQDAGPRVEVNQIIWETNTWLRNLRRLARSFGGAVPTSYNTSKIAELFGPVLAEVTPMSATATDDLPGASLFRRTLYRDFHTAVLPVILRNYDRMSMAHGVEVRMPFLDWRLVTFVFSLPEKSLLGQGYTKLILRRAMANHLPAPILSRRDKIGFSLPLTQWFNDAECHNFESLTNESGMVHSPLWNVPAIQIAIMRLKSKSTWGEISAVYACVATQYWVRQFMIDGDTV